MFGRGGRKSRTRIEPRLDGARAPATTCAPIPPTARPRRAGRSLQSLAPRPGRAEAKPRRSLLGALLYWTLRARRLGRHRARRARRLLRQPAAADRPARGAEAPAQHRHPRRRRLAARQSRRHRRRRRCGSSTCRPICPRPSSRSRTAASIRISASIRSASRARSCATSPGAGRVEGGSTLTQQLAKNLFLTQERTLSRKIQEAILALWLERKYSKDQILELYLNRVYFGSGAYGVEAAAQKYFGKSARFVIAVGGGAARRADEVADQARAQPQSRRRQRARGAGHHRHGRAGPHHRGAWPRWRSPIRRRSGATRRAGSINYAADYVMDALDDTVGAIDEDIVVTTTIDPKMQAEAERALTDELNAKGAKFGVGEGALVAIDPIGRGQGADRRAQLRREPVQPRGRRQAPAGLVVQAVRLSRGAREGPDARHGARGRADLRQGLEPGELQPRIFRPGDADQGAVAVAQHGRGPARPRGRAEDGRRRSRIGSASPPSSTPNASIALGTSEVTPLEMVSAYAAFANGGIGVQPHVIAKSAHRQRQAALRPAQRELRPRHRAAICGDDERDDAGDAAHRHRAQGRAAGLAGGRQDRHQPGLARRLVRRLHELSRRRRLARQRRRQPDEESLGRQSAGRDLEPLHEGGA